MHVRTYIYIYTYIHRYRLDPLGAGARRPEDVEELAELGLAKSTNKERGACSKWSLVGGPVYLKLV